MKHIDPLIRSLITDRGIETHDNYKLDLSSLGAYMMVRVRVRGGGKQETTPTDRMKGGGARP